MTCVEICVADVAGVAAARAGGADRVELCMALELGGLTPSPGLVTAALDQAGPLAVTVLVRPRAGGFHFTPMELEVLLRDVSALADLGRTRSHSGEPVRLEITTGVLTAEGELDVAALTRVREAAGGLPLVFHKGFDLLADPCRGLDLLGDLGFGAVLSAGGAGPARTNLARLHTLVAHRDGVTVVPAGGIRAADVGQVIKETGAQRVHLRAPLRHPQARCAGGDYVSEVETTDAAQVAAVVAQLRTFAGPPTP